MKVIGRLGRRHDIAEVVSSRLYNAGTAPTERMATAEGVKIYYSDVFRIDLGDTPRSTLALKAQEELVKILGVLLPHLTPEQEQRLREQVPNLTLL